MRREAIGGAKEILVQQPTKEVGKVCRVMGGAISDEVSILGEGSDAADRQDASVRKALIGFFGWYLITLPTVCRRSPNRSTAADYLVHLDTPSTITTASDLVGLISHLPRNPSRCRTPRPPIPRTNPNTHHIIMARRRLDHHGRTSLNSRPRKR